MSVPVTHDEIIAVRDFLRLTVAPLLDQRREDDPPFMAFLFGVLLDLMDRLVANRASVSTGHVRAVYLILREAGEWRQEHNGGVDRLVTHRTRVMDLLDRVADEQPDSTAGMPCPVLPLGIRIRDRRKERKLTQEQLGRSIGVDHMTVSRWENDQGREPAIQYRRLLAKVLGGKTSDYTRE